MVDLVSIVHQGIKNGLSYDESKRAASNAVQEEIKQMTATEFSSCLVSALFNKETLCYEIGLRFPAISNK